MDEAASANSFLLLLNRAIARGVRLLWTLCSPVLIFRDVINQLIAVEGDDQLLQVRLLSSSPTSTILY